MAIKLSGILEDGVGNPIPNCTIELKAKKTTLRVIAKTEANILINQLGSYSMNVNPGEYQVTLSVSGYPKNSVGDIRVYSDSTPGSLNDFLMLPGESDLTPELVLIFQQLRDESKLAADKAKADKEQADNILANVVEIQQHVSVDMIEAGKSKTAAAASEKAATSNAERTAADVLIVTDLKTNAETAAQQAEVSNLSANDHAGRAEIAANSVKTLTASADTLAPDVSATAQWNATTNTLLIGVPKGLKGDKGEQGIQGIQGEQGIQGIKGDIGPVGPSVSLSPLLTSLSGLTTEKDQLIYSNDVNTVTTTPFTNIGRSIVAASDTTAARTVIEAAAESELLKVVATANETKGVVDDIKASAQHLKLYKDGTPQLTKVGFDIESASMFCHDLRYATQASTEIGPLVDSGTSYRVFGYSPTANPNNSQFLEEQIISNDNSKWVKKSVTEIQNMQAMPLGQSLGLYTKTHYGNHVYTGSGVRQANYKYRVGMGAINLQGGAGMGWGEAGPVAGAPICADLGSLHGDFSPVMQFVSDAKDNGWKIWSSVGMVGSGDTSFPNYAVVVNSGGGVLGTATLSTYGRFEVRSSTAGSGAVVTDILWADNHIRVGASTTINGNGDIAGSYWNGGWLSTWLAARGVSDATVKNNIADSDADCLSLVHQFKIKQFDWNEETQKYKSSIHVPVGLIAQDAEAIDPSYIQDSLGKKQLETNAFCATLIGAVQQLDNRLVAENEELKERVIKLEAVVAELLAK